MRIREWTETRTRSPRRAEYCSRACGGTFAPLHGERAGDQGPHHRHQVAVHHVPTTGQTPTGGLVVRKPAPKLVGRAGAAGKGRVSRLAGAPSPGAFGTPRWCAV